MPRHREDPLRNVDLDSYLDHVETTWGHIELDGLLQNKPSQSIPVDRVYVSLRARRPDLERPIHPGAPLDEGSDELGIEFHRRGGWGTAGTDEAIAALVTALEERRKARSKDAGDGQTPPDPAEDVPPGLTGPIAAALRCVGVPEDQIDDDEVRAAWVTLDALEGEPTPEAVVETLVTAPIERLFRRTSHLLVEGDPGSGKTTTLQNLALRLVRAHRAPDAARELGLGERPPLPVFVPLRRLRTPLRQLSPAGLQGATAEVLVGYLREMLLGPAGGSEWLLPALKQGRLVLLLDGLDEVPEVPLRRAVARIVRAFALKYPGCRYVLSSRPSGLDATVRRSLDRLITCVVQPLDASQIECFVGAWFDALVTAPAQAQSKTRGLLETLRRQPKTAELARTPILLTAMIVVHQTRRLPERRAELYEHCVRALCGRWDEIKDEEGKLLCGPLSVEAKVGLFEEIARRIHEQGEESTSLELAPLAAILRTELATVPAFANRQSELRDTSTCKLLVEEITARSGLLLREGDIAYRFRHLSFQEFLTARWVCDREDDPDRYLAPHLADPWWHEVVVLAPAYQALGSSANARKLVTGLGKLAHDIPVPLDRADALATLGRALLDLREYTVQQLDGAAERLKPDLVRVLKDDRQRSSLEARLTLAETLARFGDPRMAEDQRWIQVPAGSFWRGSEKEDAYDREKPAGPIRQSLFWVQRWPVTVAEVQRFVEAGGYRDRDLWDPDGWTWRERERIAHPLSWERQRDGVPTLPATGLSWWESQAYCRWFTDRQPDLPPGWVVRLPTEAEWEKAARGGEALIDGDPNREPERDYPWEGPWKKGRANGARLLGGPSPVGCFPAGHGPYGAWDQSGNVWEWCLDYFDPDAYRRPEQDDPAVRDRTDAPDVDAYTWTRSGYRPVRGKARVFRGGSFWFDPRYLRVSFRNWFVPGDRYVILGFRCVAARSLSLDP